MIAGLLLLHNLAANEVNSDIGPLKFEFVLPHSNFSITIKLTKFQQQQKSNKNLEKRKAGMYIDDDLKHHLIEVSVQ